MLILRALLSREGLIFAATAAVLIAINLIWLIPTVRNVRLSASTLALAVAENTSSTVSAHIDSAMRDLRSAAEEIAFEPDRRDVVLKRVLRHNFSFRSVALIDKYGNETLRLDQLRLVGPNDLKNHSSDTGFYLALQGAETIGDVFISPELEPRADIFIPVSRLGNPLGVITADLNLRNLVLAMRAPGIGRGHIYIVNRYGYEIIHPEITEMIKRPNFADRAVVKKVLDEGRIANGLGDNEEYRNEDGEKVFAVGIPLANAGWGLFVEQPKSQAFASERQAMLFAALTVILGVLVSLTVVWGNVRLGKLNTALRELLQENYESGKMLVQRDRELASTNDSLAELNRELNEVTKVLIRRDIELSEANTRLEELDKMKSEFVSVAAHQLRTPLTGIRWSYHALLENEMGELNPEQKTVVENGLRAALSMIELINNLLNVARIEEGRFGFSFIRRSVAPLVEKVAETYRVAADNKGLKLVVAGPKSGLPLVELDEEKMAIALNNLLDNAVKYTLPGGTISLKIYSSAKYKTVNIQIKDSGIGIPEKQVSRLFSKFFRADNALSFQTLGSGLGLYVVRNIVEKHGGTIAVESKENQGTTFVITLPVSTEKGLKI